MKCKDCDRSPNCEYKADATTPDDIIKGNTEYNSGRNCPKDWHDKKAEDMTHEQAVEAVKELRKIVADINWTGEMIENLTRTNLFTPEEAIKALKDAKEKIAQTGLWENPSEATAYKQLYKKPPLGCKPSWISSCERIKELSEAITRNIGGVHKDTDHIRKWAKEILYHCEIMEKC